MFAVRSAHGAPFAAQAGRSLGEGVGLDRVLDTADTLHKFLPDFWSLLTAEGFLIYLFVLEPSVTCINNLNVRPKCKFHRGRKPKLVRVGLALTRFPVQKNGFGG